MQDEGTELFEQHRQVLQGFAYRMLGSLADARDVVQETYLKWREVELRAIENPRAWLVTVCSRIALNQLKSARMQREMYVGDWLPEPFPDEAGLDPSAQMELDDTVSVALLLALEKLTPVERAVFLLHDVFDLDFDEIAAALRKSTTNCRQLATRARKRVQETRPRFSIPPEEHRRFLEGFFGAVRRGDVGQLVALLADDVALYTDGGGKVEALPKVMCGAGRVAKFFVGIFANFERQEVPIHALPRWFNGAPGLLLFEGERLSTALSIEVYDGKIHRLYAVRNPDKLVGLEFHQARTDAIVPSHASTHSNEVLKC